jgi:hypothetical protein
MAAIAPAITAVFGMAELSLVFANLLPLTEVTTILMRGLCRVPHAPFFVHSMSYRQTVCNFALNLALDRGDTLVHGEIDKGAFDNRRQQPARIPLCSMPAAGRGAA